MALLKNGILGGIKGTVGPVVGSKWRNLDVLKSKPRPTTKNPKEGQVIQRSKFGMVNNFLKGMKSFIEIGFQSREQRISPMNAAVRYCLERAVVCQSQMFHLDYQKVKISLGPLPVATDLAIMINANGELNLSWSALREIDPSVKMERDNDKVMVAVYDPLKQRSCGSCGEFKRSDFSVGFQLPLAFIGMPLYVWTFFMSESGKQVSDSIYLGTVTVNEQSAL